MGSDRLTGPSTWLALAGAGGLFAQAGAFAALQPYQVNLVRYEITAHEAARPHVLPLIFGLVVTGAPAVIAAWVPASRASRWRTSLTILWPQLASLPLATFLVLGAAPPFTAVLLMIAGAGGSTFLAARRLNLPERERSYNAAAIASLLTLILVLTLLHVRLQINFWEHLMFGHADIGHVAEELKNVLAGRGLYDDSLGATHFVWHFVPLLYAMVPLYALWPSPVMLMTCGTVIAHVAALPLYFAARFRSGSVKVALAFALSWLLAPSVSRVVYANTYGFQWALAGLPLLAVMMAAGLVGRWKLSTAFAVLALLTRETAAAPVFGWGVYVALFTPRRRLGVAVAGAAAAYFVLCTTVLIPNAAGSDAYARLSVYGPLGTTLGNVIGGLLTRPSLVLERMLRPESAYLVCLLTVTAAGLPVAGWRLGLASVAVLLPIVLMENSEWLSIKFWNHAPVLPFLLFSGVTLLRPAGRGGVTPADVTLPRRRNDNLAIALALLVSAAWGHYLFGFSPFAKAHEVHCGSEFLQTPDPRMTLIHKLRREIPRNRTILATERVAAHFWDYRRLYTGRRVRPVDYVLIDTSDDWDTSGLPGRLDEFLAHPHYERFSDLGPLNVLKRRSNAPPVESLP